MRIYSLFTPLFLNKRGGILSKVKMANPKKYLGKYTVIYILTGKK